MKSAWMRSLPPLASALLLMMALGPSIAIASETAALTRNDSPNTTNAPAQAIAAANVKDAAASSQCQTDASRLCSAVIPGRRRVGNCLEENKSMISSAQCRKSVDDAQASYEKAWPFVRPIPRDGGQEGQA